MGQIYAATHAAAYLSKDTRQHVPAVVLNTLLYAVSHAAAHLGKYARYHVQVRIGHLRTSTHLHVQARFC